MGKPHRKSLTKEIIERLDSLMAIGESRGKAKDEARAAGEATWAFSTGKIHSYKTRQEQRWPSQAQILHYRSRRTA